MVCVAARFSITGEERADEFEDATGTSYFNTGIIVMIRIPLILTVQGDSLTLK